MEFDPTDPTHWQKEADPIPNAPTHCVAHSPSTVSLSEDEIMTLLEPSLLDARDPDRWQREDHRLLDAPVPTQRSVRTEMRTGLALPADQLMMHVKPLPVETMLDKKDLHRSDSGRFTTPLLSSSSSDNPLLLEDHYPLTGIENTDIEDVEMLAPLGRSRILASGTWEENKTFEPPSFAELCSTCEEEATHENEESSHVLPNHQNIFPCKVYRMLQDTERQGLQHIV
mmetsp:Transcript_89454/g.258032  ORF Transcript_89454/g.258032 Transcript_89454/m.258032 type:complete len:227 (-) Transcript_89454:297-977(-)